MEHDLRPVVDGRASRTVADDQALLVRLHRWSSRVAWTGLSPAAALSGIGGPSDQAGLVEAGIHPAPRLFESLWRIRGNRAPAAAAAGLRCHGGAKFSCAKSMGLAHCPLCVGLAILSVVRCSACGVMLWQLLRPQVAEGERQGRTTLRLRPAL